MSVREPQGAAGTRIMGIGRRMATLTFGMVTAHPLGHTPGNPGGRGEGDMNLVNFMNLEGFSLPGFDPVTGAVTLPWWAAAVAAALLVASWILALLRGGPAILVGSFVGVAFLALVTTVVWVGSERVGERERLAERERAEERRALSARAQDLTRAAAMPNSVLACLDSAAGETVEAGCERALFASPETVAGAMAYTAARLALLSDGADYTARRNVSYEGALPGLRAALEADRFGFAAQVLASQYDCSADHCDAFALFRDSRRIVANLKERPFDLYVGKHAANWTATARRAPIASASGASPVPPGFNVPSAASIPPVSIMVPEPPASPANTGATPADASAAPPPRRTAAPKAARPTPRPAQTAQPAQPNGPAPTVPPAANTGSAAREQ